MTEPEPLESILDNFDDISHDERRSLRTVISRFGNRAFGPVLTICGLILITPVGAIPGAPVALCIVIFSFSLQVLAGRPTPWLPAALEKVNVTQGNIDATKKHLGPVLKRLDGVVRPRFRWARAHNTSKFAAILAMMLATTLLPLGAIPFGAMLPGAIIAVIGLGIMARDGLALMVGFGLTGVAAVLLSKLILQA